MIMQSFYINLAEGMNKSAALREAKLSYMQNAKGIMAHPSFWSPFIQLGDSGPVHLKTKNGSWLPYGIIIFSFMILIIFFFLKGVNN
jgi:hypothetical protein